MGGCLKIDIHNHAFTYESASGPEEVIEAAIASGLDGIAFTEHNSYTASGMAEELKREYSGRITIFRGAEYDAAEGHLILFGITDNGFMDLGMFAPASEVLRYLEPRGAVAIIAHPFRGAGRFKTDLSLVKGITAVEAYNGHNTPGENEMALRAAASLGLPTTGGSDSHGKEDVGRCYTEFLDMVTEEGLVAALKSGRYRGVCVRP
ncbi:MAG: PHP domain-containing protein [Deltaproteobacteria bacterium]|nr:PHP domain-containing protein [Deltaproteobacteria bacterium]MBZ0219842.1 PHP domain-containing protein [Deltaproteobacteria bacterium]